MLIVYTGNGKGKTTAALGLIFRALGYGWKICMIQFIKGDWHCGELDTAKQFSENLEIYPIGEGFYKIRGDKKTENEHKASAQSSLKFAEEKLTSGEYDLIIFDEINNAIEMNLISVEQVLKLVEKTPEKTDVVCTGRNAPTELIEMADLVTEMKEIKHPFQQGISAKKGLDF
ncbi:MAG: cob(I)yrinic acid a,c-diamide adenosyltransferase [Candidatus Marinimicrobia bacterium]|nr:cob(I)yrinic acid a,c-diamide adenosyltransferase [Candidatus Neomarinimicrobiota bacterium]